MAGGLKPIIKWAGGKEKELKYILSNLPLDFDNYYEPFVGGGSVFMSISAKRYFINDISSELISLYMNISTQNNRFFDYVIQINKSWIAAYDFFKNHMSLIDKYLEYRSGKIDDIDLYGFIDRFCNENQEEIVSILGGDFNQYHRLLLSEIQKNLLRKIKRMKVLELTKHILPAKDIADNIETAIKSALYMYYRHLYNDTEISNIDPLLHSALFYFIRNYCYSGMFRYNIDGKFNVPYGGIAYNSKTLEKKIEYYHSKKIVDHFECSSIYSLDFEDFLREMRPTERDFIFLDPPYDSEFSTYAQNEFTKEDQCRLANYLLNDCNSRWMMIIKNTDFILNLYTAHGLKIQTFDKEYLVSFMNRNNRKATHLLITNY